MHGIRAPLYIIKPMQRNPHCCGTGGVAGVATANVVQEVFFCEIMDQIDQVKT